MKEIIWDVVVVGGGPAGMMAAGTAASNGAKVILIEKKDSLGKKLLITGGGRCNVTNSEFDVRKFLDKFKENGKYLFSAFSRYGVKETLDFFHKRGMETKVENELRTFPVSNSAQSVWNVLVDSLKENRVTILSDSPVKEMVCENQKLIGVKLPNNNILRGKNIIIATGGTSRPETGSTGDAYKWLGNLGHTIIEPTPSLVPISIKDKWVKRLAGVSFNNIKLTIFQNNVKQHVTKGKILFTHVGVSGPTILNISKDVGELLKYGDVTISLDLLPEEDYGTLNKKLQDLFKENAKKKFKNALSNIIPSSISPIIVELLGINSDIKCSTISREGRLDLVQIIKGIPLHVDKLLGLEKAVISSGGVVLEEVDFKTMQSRLYPNLFLVGDVLNIDRPSGGYSLQLCWTTGYVAGTTASE
jgi:predicted Rossmann fold flavoprotein